MKKLVIAIALALSGCMVGPNYERPDLNLPASYGEAGAATAIAVPAKWWTLYGDETLNRLVDEGLANSADVRLAAARVEEAEAAYREVRATVFFPLVQGNAGATRGRGPATDMKTASGFTLGLSTSFEVDLWGRLRRAEQATRDVLLASQYGRDTVALTLAASITRAYFAALSLDTQYEASLQISRAAEEAAGLAKKRANAGIASDLDVYQADSLRTAASAQAKEISRQRAAIVHQLGVLTGRLDVTVPARRVMDLPIPPLPPPGLPSQILERRPDVHQAEAQLQAATERIGVARGSQFPALTLTASIGEASGELSSLFSTGSRMWSIGAGLLGPVLDGGRYAARTDQAVAQAKQAQAVYQRTVETAFREVADALSNVRLAADTETDLVTHLEQSRQALRLAQLRYERGYSAYLEVLDAQRTLNDAQLAFIRNRQAYLSYTVDLMNSLGGGWSPT
jgi:multidrug efflux system outer membrane protein